MRLGGYVHQVAGLRKSMNKWTFLFVGIAALVGGLFAIDALNSKRQIHSSHQANVVQHRQPLTKDEIQAYLASLKGNSIDDCLAKQLGSPELHPEISHSSAPCPVRDLERGHWLKVHFAGKARIPVPYVQAGDLPRSGNGAERSISIYLIGGPVEHVDDNLANLPVLQALPPNSVWVFPIYQGTGFRAPVSGRRWMAERICAKPSARSRHWSNISGANIRKRVWT